MNYLLLISFAFILGFVSVSANIELSYAETYRGSDYSLTTNQDGSYTRTIGLAPFINNPLTNSFVPFVYTDDIDFHIVETQHGSVKLNKSACTFEYYSNGYITNPVYDSEGNIVSWFHKDKLFSDSIIPLMANEGTMAYSIIDSINNEICSTSWNGSELTATKLKPGVGLLEYKYILNNGKWKTQLEATNLSSLTDKQFGFTQTIDLNRDIINYGGQQRNLDNFNNTTFDRSWLENNEGKTMNLLNGFYFDFDLGFDNLYQVNVFDTGINQSKLSFDYVYNQNVILPGETLIIDPTFGANSATVRQITTTATTGASCGTPSTVTTDDSITKPDSVGSSACEIVAISEDVSSFPDNRNTSQIDINFTVDTATIGINCDYVEMTVNPLTDTATNIWNDITTPNSVYNNNNADCATTGAKTITLGGTALTVFDSETSQFNIGMLFDSMTRDGSTHTLDFSGVTMTVTYSLPPDPPKQAGGSESGNTIPLTWLAGALNGDTHSTFEVERLNLDGSTWDELVSQASVNYTDSSPQVNATAKYRIWDTGALGRGCSQFVMNSTVTANLQSHFPFCYTVNDNGILNNTGTVTGNELYTNSTGNILFDFDGLNYIVVPNEVDYDFERTQPTTIVFDFKIPTGTTAGIISKTDGATSNRGLIIELATNQINYYLINTYPGNMMRVYTNTSYSDGTLHQAIITYDGSSNASGVIIYIDGVAVATTTANDTLSATILNNVALTIGAYSDGTSILADGNLSDIMYFDIELDANQVEQLYLERIDTSGIVPLFNPPGTPTLSASALSDSAIRYTNVPGIAGDNSTIWYGLQCELNGAGSWSATVTNSSYVSFYEYTGLTVGDVNICQWRNGSVDGWSNWSNNATDILTLAVLSAQRTSADTDDKLFQFIEFIAGQGGVYFGLGALPFGVMLIGFMAGKKTVRIFTLATLFLMGIIHASGYYVYDNWYWTMALLFGIILVMGRMKSD